MGFPKKLLGRDESLVMILRPHVKRLFVPALVLVVVAPAATLAAALVPDGSVQTWARGLIALAALLALLRWTVAPFVTWWNTIYVITDRRLIMRHGVLSRSGHDMPISRLNDVSFEHNLFERMLGCGTLTVESAGERGQVVLADVPKVEEVQRVLYRLSDEARQGELAGLREREGLGERDDVDAPYGSGDGDGDGDGDEDEGRRGRWGRRRT